MSSPLPLHGTSIDDVSEEYGDAGRKYLHIVVDPDQIQNLESEEISALIKELLGKLTHRERRITMWRYGLNGSNEMTLEEIGRELGLSRERVRQIETNDILPKLNNACRKMGYTKHSFTYD